MDLGSKKESWMEVIAVSFDSLDIVLKDTDESDLWAVVSESMSEWTLRLDSSSAELHLRGRGFSL